MCSSDFVNHSYDYSPNWAKLDSTQSILIARPTQLNLERTSARDQETTGSGDENALSPIAIVCHSDLKSITHRISRRKYVGTCALYTMH